MRFKAGSGDAGQFILLQAVARGGQLITTNGYPTISGVWFIEFLFRTDEDIMGATRTPSEHYEQLRPVARKLLQLDVRL